MADTKKCSKCKKEKYFEHFPLRKDSRDGRSSSCKDCKKEYWEKVKDLYNEKRKKRYRECMKDDKLREIWKRSSKEYRERNIEKVRECSNRRKREVRKEVIKKYGGQCACCKELNLEFLCIDHIDGGGNKERKSGIGVTKLYLILYNSQELMLDKYRVLCHNCNMSLGFYGYCPHAK